MKTDKPAIITVPPGEDPSDYGINTDDYTLLPDVPTNREIFNLEDEFFYLDSLDELGTSYLETVKEIQAEVDRLYQSTEIARIAKNAVIDKMIEIKDNFEMVSEDNFETDADAETQEPKEEHE